MREPVLSVHDLVVDFETGSGVLRAVDHLSFDVFPSETVGVVGESGSGKSVTALAIMRLLDPRRARVRSGRIMFNGVDLLTLSERDLRNVRGAKIGIVFQDPMSSLNPSFPIGYQIGETLRVHRGTSKSEARSVMIDTLRLVGIPNPSERIEHYPHQLSGGMRQRAMIAMAIVNRPSLLIADEPTTALDVTIQAQVLDVLRTVQEETEISCIFISHDLAVVSEVANRIVVMYAGSCVETGTAWDVLHDTRHPYTKAMLKSVPSAHYDVPKLVAIPGRPPDPLERPSGCPFHPRCYLSEGRAVCKQEEPALEPAGPNGHASACHFHSETHGSVVPVSVES